MKVLVFVFMILGFSYAKQLISSDEIDTLFKKAFRHNLSDEETKTLQDVIDIAYRPERISRRSLGTYSAMRNTLECLICRSAFGALFDVLQNGQGDGQVTETVRFFCVVLGIESDSVCDGVTRLNLPIITYIIRNAPQAAPGTFCSLVLQNAQDPNVCPHEDARFEWQVELPAAIEPVTRNEIQLPLTIAIITDAHLDPLYEPYGVADCDEPTCCRKGQSPTMSFNFKSNIDEDVVAESVVKVDDRVMLDLSVAPKINEKRRSSQTWFRPRDSAPAGYWGDYRNCDTPVWAFDDVIDTITETHRNIDAVYYLGDTIDHFVWKTTYEGINEMNRHVIDKIRSNFGDNVPVVPVIGNHESQPTNQFAPPSVTEEGLNTTWLYKALADKWGFYLSEDAQRTLRERGEFSVLIRPGLRAISINNNIAYRYNWWLVYDPEEPKRHLDWLIEELLKAEQAGEKVHILAHIPPGVHDLAYTWTREYNRIVNRFSSTIAAEFNGHMHSDEFKIFYDSEGQPIVVAWGAGSATSYTLYNLNYKIATFNTETYEPLNIVNYVYNLTEANLTPNRRPHWFQLYDMRNSFALTDLSAISMNNLVTSMVTDNRQMLDLYSAFYSKLSDSRWPWCNAECKLNDLCKVVVTVLWERQRCDELVQLYNANN